MNDHYIKNILDTFIGGGAITSPAWVQLLQTGGVIFMTIGGALLLALRLAITWKEWKKANGKQ